MWLILNIWLGMLLQISPVLPLKTWLQNLNNQPVLFKIQPQDKATVILFLSPECPLCQSYSLTINQLQNKFKNNNIRFVAVVPGNAYTGQNIMAFKHKYKLQQLEWFIDTKLELTRKLKAQITPEVFVINKKNELVYQGRIDNWAYELSKKRAVITEHDLKNVLTQIVNGKAVSFYKTKAIGCFIE
jgi:thiol-disulfide isomerase/thioredoxin